MDQPDLFEASTVEAIRRRNEGMAVAWENDLNAMYRDRLLAAIHHLAGKGQPFGADEARSLAGDPPRFVHPNISGACFRAAASMGLIRLVGYDVSRRPVGHGNRTGRWIGTQR